MNDVPFISVVTVCREAAGVIGRALDSVAAQTRADGAPFLDYEHVIIDGGSRDATLEVVHTYVAQQEGRGVAVTVLSEPDEGIYDAMNKGLELARGRYVGFLNADDWYAPQALATVAAQAGTCADVSGSTNVEAATAQADVVPDSLVTTKNASGGPDCIGGACVIIERDGLQGDATLCAPCERTVRVHAPLPAMLTQRYPQEMPAQHQALFVRTNLLREVGGFRTQFPIAADYDLCLRLLALSRQREARGEPALRWAFTDEVLARFTLGGASYHPTRTARDYRDVRRANGWPWVRVQALYIKNSLAAVITRALPGKMR